MERDYRSRRAGYTGTELSESDMDGWCSSSARLDGKVAVVTGGSSGVGREAARALARRGARVVLAGRDAGKMAAAREYILADAPRADVATRHLDLASLASVRRFAGETARADPALHMLVNDAGAVALPDALTGDGLHRMMQVNYFGMFLLTYLLVPLLRASAPSRVVSVTGAVMYVGSVDLGIMNDVGRRSTVALLADAKLATALFSVELDRRLAGSGVTSVTVDPFLVADTGFLREFPAAVRAAGALALRVVGRRPAAVGAELAYLAAAPELAGSHYKYCVRFPNAWQTHDAALAASLWDVSKRLVNVTAAEDWEIEHAS